MVHLMRMVDRALGYAFVSSEPLDPETASLPKTRVPNTGALFSSASSIIPDAPKVQDVQERWVDHREGWDAWEKAEWRREGQIVKAQAQQNAKRSGP